MMNKLKQRIPNFCGGDSIDPATIPEHEFETLDQLMKMDIEWLSRWKKQPKFKGFCVDRNRAWTTFDCTRYDESWYMLIAVKELPYVETKIKCDEELNTPDVVERNELKASIIFEKSGKDHPFFIGKLDHDIPELPTFVMDSPKNDNPKFMES